MLCEIAENYFNNINPLASRICGDIRRIRAAYEDLWTSFSADEREQIINETIIQPGVLLKYPVSAVDVNQKGGCSFASGTKIVVDENTGNTWRDEHSAPFSWKARSQLNLCHNKRCVPALPQSAALPEVKEYTEESTPPKIIVDAHDDADTTYGAFSDFCSRLLPGKSRDYQISQTSGEGSIFSKFKSSTVCKLQNTLRLVSGRVGNRKAGEGEMLVLGSRAVVVPRAQKTSPKKPTSPPPPPPPRVLLQRDQAETPLLAPNTPILDEKIGHDQAVSCPQDEQEELNDSPDSFELPVVPPLFGSAIENETDNDMPKSGFDFLDNW